MNSYQYWVKIKKGKKERKKGNDWRGKHIRGMVEQILKIWYIVVEIL